MPTSIRRWLTATMVPLALLGLPAGAGTEADPEVTDECARPPTTLPLSAPLPPQVDVCAGWIQGIWTPVLDGDGAVVDHALEAVRTTVTVAGMLDHPLPGTDLELSWSNGGCRQVAWVKFTETGGAEPRFGDACATEPDWVELPPEALEVSDDRVTITVPVAAVNDQVSQPLQEDVRLAAPRIIAANCVGLVTADGDYPCGNVYGAVDVSDEPGRDHVLGQDKPPADGQPAA